ncbi:hypothetical protein EVAR_61528_1 [Eumeta japonica]|uniref:Integrase zinc-binding domain-containing protein n=1 Tax=Eumeta variegata TaxID=151549 RepID=A0A4C1YW51_EUMVA|nr:hypothetical protein EVAR_61528_1 [Eumeta japonica]
MGQNSTARIKRLADRKPIILKETGEEKILHLTVKKPDSNILECIPNIDKFSKWSKLIRSTACVLQFIRLCRKNREKVNYKRTKRKPEKDPSWKKSNKKPYNRTSNKLEIRKNNEVKTLSIDIDLLYDAEKLLQKACQQQSFPQEISDLRNGKTISTRSRLYKLSIEMHDNIMRIKTRIGRADDLTEMQKHPPILSGDHHITRLYIEHTHRQLHHAGAEATINECRQRYYITRIRTVTRYNKAVYSVPNKESVPASPHGDHLSNRLAHHRRPFTYTG